MNQLEKHYNRLKGVGVALSAVQTQAQKELTEFVKVYGNLYLNTDGVPHTVTDFGDDDCPTKQICLVFWHPTGKLMVKTVSGETLSHFSFDDISYLIEDLSEECLEYAETSEEPKNPSDNLNYVMVNVPGKYGYSFMVTTKDDNLSEQGILTACLNKDLFEAEEDIERASIDRDVSEEDIRFFKSGGCTHNID